MADPAYQIAAAAVRLAPGPRAAPPALPAPPAQPDAGRRWRATARRWSPALPAAVTLTVMLWGITGPSYWRDEAATIAATQRPLPSLLGMLARVDAVHGLYYLVMWGLVRLAGTGELALRLPSALAMAGAAALVALTGRRLAGPRAGVAAGLLLTALPAASWAGQDARPFALETAVACAASYLLLRFLDAGRPPGRRTRAAYTLSLVLLGLVNLFGLLLIPAHAATVTVCARGPGRGQVLRSWLAGAAAAVVALVPFGVLAWGQRGQIGWLRPPGWVSLWSLTRLAGSPPLGLAIAVIAACSLAAAGAAGVARFRAAFPARLPALCLPWLLTPPTVLLAVSTLHPVFIFRYVEFCMPALALLAGAAFAAAGRAAAVCGLAVAAVLGLPAQAGERGPAGHGDSIRQADQIVSVHARPRDAVLYLGGPGMRTFGAAYPWGLARLHDIGLGHSASRSATISGTPAPRRVVAGRLTRVSRLWVIQLVSPAPPGTVTALRGTSFRLLGAWRAGDLWLRLYARAPAPPRPTQAQGAARPAPGPAGVTGGPGRGPAGVTGGRARAATPGPTTARPAPATPRPPAAAPPS